MISESILCISHKKVVILRYTSEKELDHAGYMHNKIKKTFSQLFQPYKKKNKVTMKAFQTFSVTIFRSYKKVVVFFFFKSVCKQEPKNILSCVVMVSLRNTTAKQRDQITKKQLYIPLNTKAGETIQLVIRVNNYHNIFGNET